MLVNGRAAIPGQQVTPGVDQVTVDGRPIEPVSERTYLMLNKPVGVLSSVGDPRGRPTITDQLGAGRRVFPVGRLDLDSRGLVLLTDDGELAMRLMHPRYGVEKEYIVLVSGRPNSQAFQRLAGGMTIGSESFQPADIRIIDQGPNETRLAMVLREGRKREVRRLWQALGHQVIDLQRVRIDGLRLGSLEEGGVRPLTAEEVASLKAAVS
ncbi:MAG TPA: pseudouridine synthase [Candidatus Dormibacteraeota bacterium]|nr:pseudouridine synthase [Candidatus Dormibacteraeota bacterium]